MSGLVYASLRICAFPSRPLQVLPQQLYMAMSATTHRASEATKISDPLELKACVTPSVKPLRPAEVLVRKSWIGSKRRKWWIFTTIPGSAAPVETHSLVYRPPCNLARGCNGLSPLSGEKWGHLAPHLFSLWRTEMCQDAKINPSVVVDKWQHIFLLNQFSGR